MKKFLDINYWKPAIEHEALVIHNGDYSIFPSVEFNTQENCEYVAFNVRYKREFFASAGDINRALKMAAEHFDENSK